MKSYRNKSSGALVSVRDDKPMDEAIWEPEKQAPKRPAKKTTAKK